MNVRQSLNRLSRCRRGPPGRGAHGLTLVEMLVGLLVMSVLLTIAVPSFQDIGKRTRLDLQVADLRSALDYARAEAARRGVRVVVCSVGNKKEARFICADGRKAWGSKRDVIAFVDNVHLAGNEVAKVDAGVDQILRRWEPPEDAVVTTTYVFGGWVAFTPQGRVVADTADGNVWGGIAICQAPYARKLELNGIGRVAEKRETCE